MLANLLLVHLFHRLLLLVFKGIEHSLGILLRHLLLLLVLLLLLLVLILLLVLLLLLFLLVLLLLLLLLLLLVLILAFRFLEDGRDLHIEIGHGKEIAQWLHLHGSVAHLVDDIFLELIARLGGIVNTWPPFKVVSGCTL